MTPSFEIDFPIRCVVGGEPIPDLSRIDRSRWREVLIPLSHGARLRAARMTPKRGFLDPDDPILLVTQLELEDGGRRDAAVQAASFPPTQQPPRPHAASEPAHDAPAQRAPFPPAIRRRRTCGRAPRPQAHAAGPAVHPHRRRPSALRGSAAGASSTAHLDSLPCPLPPRAGSRPRGGWRTTSCAPRSRTAPTRTARCGSRPRTPAWRVASSRSRCGSLMRPCSAGVRSTP